MSETNWPYPFPAPPDQLVQYVGGGDFLAIGRSLRDEVIRAGLRPDHSILDVGCGVGRLAVPLTDYLSPVGRFRGFDVHQPSIDWCATQLTPRFPNFQFSAHDIRHPHYNPGGAIAPTRFQYPYPDQSFDFVSPWSVFTHLQLPEVRHFRAEIRRVLVAGGRLLVSCFLLTEEREASARKSDFYRGMTTVAPGIKALDPKVPEKALAYAEPLFLRELTAAGFRLEEKQYGTWCGTNRHTFLGYQDKLILRPRP